MTEQRLQQFSNKTIILFIFFIFVPEAVRRAPYASITAMWCRVGSYELGVYTQNVILISLTQR